MNKENKLTTIIEIAKNVGLKISTAALMALVVFGAANCKGGDEITEEPKNRDKHYNVNPTIEKPDGIDDITGVNVVNGGRVGTLGFDKDGLFENSGWSRWDANTGKDYKGDTYYLQPDDGIYNSYGNIIVDFNPVTKLHRNGTAYSKREGIDSDYYNGINYNGDMKPIKLMDINNTNITSSNIPDDILGCRIDFRNYSRDLVSQFTRNDGTTTANERILAGAAANLPNQPPFNLSQNVAVRGDDIVDGVLLGSGNYVITLSNMVENIISDFPLLLDAYRTQCYMDHRAKGDKTNYPASGELAGFYRDLNIPNNNIKAYFNNTVIPTISRELGINKGRVESLFNHIDNTEHIYSIVDDVHAMKANGETNLNPVEPKYTGTYTRTTPVRTTEYVHRLSEAGFTQQQQQTSMSREDMSK